jgi:hypothetical protein
MALGAVQANAEVRYTNVTPDLSTQFITNSKSSIDVFIDFDGQAASTGVQGDPVLAPAGTDFRLDYTGDSAEKPEISFQGFGPNGSNWAAGQIAKIGNNFDYANMFGAHEEIGASYNPPPVPPDTTSSKWASGGWLENADAGPWNGGGTNGVDGVGTGFLGVRLDFDGTGIDYNYGWAQVRYDDAANKMTLLDFAIETQINTAITTPALTPAPLVGDFNGDHVVDGADLTKLKMDYGAGAGSDANGDGVTDGADFMLWQRHVGQSAAAAAVSAVPEPHCLLLAAMGVGGLQALRRRRES